MAGLVPAILFCAPIAAARAFAKIALSAFVLAEAGTNG